MEFDLTRYRWPLIALAVLTLLAGLGWIGYAYTPENDGVLTWAEWQVFKARRAYRQELGALQAAGDTLAALLDARPDPVRAQLEAARIQRLAAQGQPSLAYPREKLSVAAQSVSDWATGAIERETARAALDEALHALAPAPETAATSPVNRIYLPLVAKGTADEP